MENDRVTITSAANSYGNRCRHIGQNRRDVSSLQDAMSNPRFRQDHHKLLDKLSADYRLYGDAAAFPTWKTIKLGLFSATLDRMLCDYYHIAGNASLMLENTPISEAVLEIDLICINVETLPIPWRNADWVSRSEIYDAAFSIGLERCPAEVGPQLRWQYPDQKSPESLRIAMDPVTIPHLKANMYYEIGDTNWLYGNEAEHFVLPDNQQWIFQRRRNFRHNA